MKVAIVGGSGMLGRHIAAGLAARGSDVVILARNPSSAKRSRSARMSVRGWSVADRTGLAHALAGVDAVINLAGVPVGPRPWTRARKRAILESRLEATRAIVAALAAIPSADRPRILVSASGTDTYTGLDRLPASETTPPSGGFLARVCLAWEAAALAARSSEVRVVVLRIGFVLACDAPSLRLYALPFRVGLGGPIGHGQQWMSWIHVDDLVALTLFVLDEPRAAGIVNAVGPVPARQAEVADAIGAALRRPSWLAVPAWLVRAVMRSQAILPLGSRRIAPARAFELGFRFGWPDLRTAMADVLRPGDRRPASQCRPVRAMTGSKRARTWIACLLVGVSGGTLTLVFPSLGLLLVAAGALPAAVSAMRYAALGGLLTGLGATWLVLIAAANARCQSFNSFPGHECSGPDLGPLLTVSGAMLAAGVLLSVGALVRGRRP